MPSMPNGRTGTPSRRYRFDEIATNVNDRVDNPAEADVECYVGLEHLDPDSLKIRRWGSPSDVSATKLKFRAGDIIFGRRRAYQRKLGVAETDGICSAHAMVLRANPRVVLPELLPFFMQSDSFMNRAVEISVGSLSPTINWTTLAKQEFMLPSFERQRKLAGMFTELEKVINAYWESATSLAAMIEAFVLSEYRMATAMFTLARLADAGDVRMGRQKAPRFRKGVSPHPFLSVANMGRLELLFDSMQEMDFSDQEVERYRLKVGDLLLTEGDLISEFNVGRAAVYEAELEDCCFQNTLVRFRPGDDLIPQYALLTFEGARLSGVFARTAKTTTVSHLGLGRLSEVRIPLPPRNHQEEVANTFTNLLATRRAIHERRADLMNIRRRALQEFS